MNFQQVASHHTIRRAPIAIARMGFLLGDGTSGSIGFIGYILYR